MVSLTAADEFGAGVVDDVVVDVVVVVVVVAAVVVVVVDVVVVVVIVDDDDDDDDVDGSIVVVVVVVDSDVVDDVDGFAVVVVDDGRQADKISWAERHCPKDRTGLHRHIRSYRSACSVVQSMLSRLAFWSVFRPMSIKHWVIMLTL